MCNVLELGADFLGADTGLIQGAFGEDEREFLSSVSAGQVVGTDGPKQGISDKTEGFVAGGVSEGVVVALEIIDIEHHQGERPPLATGTENLAFEEFLHVAAVVEAGQGVVDGLLAESFAQVEIGNRESDVFCDGGSQLVATSEAF